MKKLYHYCSTDTFCSIIKNRTIWLSSLSLSNDTMEGRLVNDAMMRIAERDGLDPYAKERLREHITLMEQMFDGVGFCLSTEGDLLSQWRGYADDGKGFSIGFSDDYLKKIAENSKTQPNQRIFLHEISYNLKDHESLVEPTYIELRKLIDAGALRAKLFKTLLSSTTDQEIEEENKKIEKANMVLFYKILTLTKQLFKLKSPAFSEEKEWRLFSLLIPGITKEFQYRAAGNKIIPYISLNLPILDTQAIKEVILGPKHTTPTKIVESILEKSGFDGVEVRASEATYR